MQAHHDRKPDEPLWLSMEPIELQEARTAPTAWVEKHPCAIDAARCRGFEVRQVKWLDVSAWSTPA